MSCTCRFARGIKLTMICRLVVDELRPSKEEYATHQPWKYSADKSSLAALTQVSRFTRAISLPIVWAYVYVQTMKIGVFCGKEPLQRVGSIFELLLLFGL